VNKTGKCTFCTSPATEANSLCFACSEEIATLTYKATIELGYSTEKAKANAQAVWKG
jgi:hypothetical protein